MNRVLKIFISVIILISCNKFEHHDSIIQPSCELCNWANNLEGTYSGEMTTSITTSGPPVIWYDSIYIQVSHYFANNNSINDSSVMYFNFKIFRDSINDPNPINRIMVAHDSSSALFSSYFTKVNLTYNEIFVAKTEAGSLPQSFNFNESSTLTR